MRPSPTRNKGCSTGVGGGERGCPRSICATSLGSSSLNKYLVTHFKLAFAGENLVSLADMTDVNYIARVVRGLDAVVLSTTYELETWPVTGGTFETTPNSKTQEFYMGGLRRGGVRRANDLSLIF